MWHLKAGHEPTAACMQQANGQTLFFDIWQKLRKKLFDDKYFKLALLVASDDSNEINNFTLIIHS